MILDNPNRLSFSGFASAMALAGDIDGDGLPDYLVGAYDHPWDKNDHQGRAFVFSSASGKLLYAVDNPEPQRGSAFGYSVTSVGDVSNDKIPDLLIGAFGHDGSGKAFVMNGKDGKLLYAVHAPQRQSGAGFGWSVTALGDTNQDGIAELVVGAFAQAGTGQVFVFNGKDGKLLYTIAAPAGAFAFGWSVDSAGDLNKDGTPDLLVGAPYTNGEKFAVQGRAYAFNGRDGTLLYTIESPQPTAGAVFGWRVTSGGDLNKDGTPDILVGAPYQNVGDTLAQGVAYAINGVDGKLLFVLNDPVPRPYAAFGLAIIQSQDVNQDNVPEIVVGAPYQTVDQFHVQGEVFLFNGQDGRHLVTFDDPYPHQGATFGYSLATPGDLDKDQIPEFAVGASGQGILDKVAVGRVFVFFAQP
jgi:hypothetical protein